MLLDANLERRWELMEAEHKQYKVKVQSVLRQSKVEKMEAADRAGGSGC